jgi:ubiquitin C-terminal hydrolase
MDKHKEYKLKLPRSAYEKKGLTGIENLGNTCYVNSIIQCLSNTLKITDYILTNEYKKDDPREKNKILGISWSSTFRWSKKTFRKEIIL